MSQVTLISVNFDADLRYFFSLGGSQAEGKILRFKLLVF